MKVGKVTSGGANKRTSTMAQRRGSTKASFLDEDEMDEDTKEIMQGGISNANMEQEDTGPIRFVDHPLFNGIIMGGILVNALQMGLEVQFDGEPAETVWFCLEQFFTAFFLIEMIIKLSPLMGPREYFTNRQNWLDFVVVVVAVVDNWIISLIMDGDGGFGFISILRLVRLARILKLLRAKRELMMLIEGIVSSIRSMFWLSILLSILIYVVSIMLVKFIGQSDAYPAHEKAWQEKYFGDLAAAAMTGLNLALMSDWTYVARPILKYQPFIFCGLGLYVGISCFGIMNAIIGVIVSRTSQAARDAELEDLAKFRERQMIFVENIRDIIYEIDMDGDGTVSPDEIVQAESNESLCDALGSVDLPVGFSMIELHCMLDKDGDGSLTKFEFGQGMRRLIFSNDFQRQCLMMLAVAQQKRKLFDVRSEIIEKLEEVEQGLNAKMDELPNRIVKQLRESLPEGMVPAMQRSEDSDKIIPQPEGVENEKSMLSRKSIVSIAPTQASDESPVGFQRTPMSKRGSVQSEATAAALEEVSQALAVAARTWSDLGSFPVSAAWGDGRGMDNSNLRQSGIVSPDAGYPNAPHGFENQVLLPGIVNQHVHQISAANLQGAQMYGNQPPQAGMQQGEMDPSANVFNPAAGNFQGSSPNRRNSADVVSLSIV